MDLCIFFMKGNCRDGDQCLYTHKEGTLPRRLCKNINSCTDLTCKFSHDSSETLCKFQEMCNMSNCSFKHNTERLAFLEKSRVYNCSR